MCDFYLRWDKCQTQALLYDTGTELFRLGHEKISAAILPFPLIQEEQLSDTGEKNVH